MKNKLIVVIRTHEFPTTYHHFSGVFGAACLVVGHFNGRHLEAVLHVDCDYLRLQGGGAAAVTGPLSGVSNVPWGSGVSSIDVNEREIEIVLNKLYD